MERRAQNTACFSCPLKWAAAVLILLGIASSTAQAQPVRIVEPVADEILYGKTRIVVEITSPSEVGRVRFYLDQFKRAICVSMEAPHTCEFDAGTDFQGRIIRVDAMDRTGGAIGQDRIETLAFPAPIEVVRYVVTVPVVAIREQDEPIDLAQLDLDCEYVRKPCEPLEFRRMTDSQRFPLSIEVLVDVSGSVNVQRDLLFEAVKNLIDVFPDHAEVAIVEFGDLYRRLGEFTTDRAALHEQVQMLSVDHSRTCLLRAIDRSLTTLAERPGHKALFIMSDGIDTCDSRWTGSGNSLTHRVTMGARYHVVELARDNAIPIYIFRVQQTTTSYRQDMSYEGIALETGGRLFATGENYGVMHSFDNLVEDLKSTWLVDVMMPRGVQPGVASRLWLSAPEDSGVKLRYPEYWDPGITEKTRIAYADAEQGEARLWAAQGLRGTRNPRALKAMLNVLAIEPDDRLRIEQLTTIYDMAAHMLLHGDETQQKAALDAVVDLHAIDPTLLDRLQPALRVYQEVDVPERMKRKAARFIAPPSGTRAPL